MGTTHDAIEGDAAAECAFAHIDAFPMCPAVPAKGDFQVNPTVAGTHLKGAVQLGCAAVMYALPFPPVFCGLSLIVELLIRQLLASPHLVLGSLQDGVVQL